MIPKLSGTWFAALGTSLMLMSVQAYGIVQKPMPTPKSAAAKPVAAKPAAAAPKAATTTLTGCLRMDGNRFELTNPKGSDVSTGRSWKRGFIMKTAKNVSVVGASANVKLKDHVGREVSVSGTRSDDTHLSASSIRRVATACN